ncbi:MAG: helix-turn-helix transcriptional regulator [Clostridia bacterium]|nr:helix-turn-helix transcriptional regulator [Clostridia bacterium]MBR6781019.1 helix-turn-helix transcriptional regulator [Clostridia bacterium]
MDATYGRIKSLCDERGIKLSVLAAEIGVRSSVFTELKMGRTKQLSAKTLQAIAAYFDISVDSLMPQSDDAQVDTMRDEMFRKRRMLFDLSAKASPEELDTILKVVNALIAQP